MRSETQSPLRARKKKRVTHFCEVHQCYRLPFYANWHNHGKTDEAGRSLTPRPAPSQVDLREVLKPYYLDQVAYERDGDQLKQKSPRSLLRSFNPLPSEAILRKLNYYFFPYNKKLNTNKCMYFDEVDDEARSDDDQEEQAPRWTSRDEEKKDLFTLKQWSNIHDLVFDQTEYGLHKRRLVIARFKTALQQKRNARARALPHSLTGSALRRRPFPRLTVKGYMGPPSSRQDNGSAARRAGAQRSVERPARGKSMVVATTRQQSTSAPKDKVAQGADELHVLFQERQGGENM